MYPKGTLIAIGGAEDKGHQNPNPYLMDFVKEGILSHVVDRAGGIDASILLITSASSVPREIAENYSKAFTKLGCRNLEILHITSQDEADSTEVLARISQVDALMFSGGNQSVLSDIFRNSDFLNIVKERYYNEEFVVAGTSAGAMAMSEVMIAGGSSTDAMIKGAVHIIPGLGLLPEVIFDSHFIRRGRFGRLTEAIALHTDKLGIGLGEDTGLIIEKGKDFLTIGSGMVILFDGSHFKHNTVQQLSAGIPISISNLIVHVLANSDRYKLREKRVEVLPIDAKFI